MSSSHVSPRVSVIIPTYNCASYIEGALRSVAIQQYSHIEVIVVDDGSTDNTADVVAGAPVDVRFICQASRRGPASARNTGIRLARGEYIAFLDADDEWLPGKLDHQVAVLQRMPAVIAVSTEMVAWDDTTKQSEEKQSRKDSTCAVPGTNNRSETLGPTADLELVGFDQLVVKNRICTPTVLCRKESLAEVGWFDESMNISEDYDLWLRLSRTGKIACIGRPFARYRQRPEGLSAGNRDRTMRLDLDFVRSIPRIHQDHPKIRRLVQRGIAARELEYAIELCDERQRYSDAAKATLRSIWQWPWTDPSMLRRPFIRCRRMRRILIDALGNRPKNSWAGDDVRCQLKKVAS
ncbi:glycosyltransferase [Stieleria sp. JC731]|uniref:glycosyltransferase family 2 protein n=1 Tax=Pirellulaceae TaxID=2691357 RepID=UPI001E59BAE9|nr:glycosyltransferase [Stieleria sp. JC731]MCC9599511.1 glycosyltransferase [Stieleria sp. JC731]